MKLEFVTFAALAASAAAVPLRIITLTGPVPVPHLPPSEVSHSLHDEEEMRIMPHPHPAHMPCGKGQGSPFTDLLTRLGLVRPHPGHHHGHEQGSMHESAANSDEHHHENEYKVVKAWKHHVEEMMGKVVPVLEGGDVRILPFTEDDRDKFEAEQVNGHGHGHGHGHGNEYMVGQKYEHGHGHGREHGQGRGGHLRAHGGHHWRHQSSSFGGRLHRAILHLTPPEAIALAFVLGAGIGSIMHLIFMFFLISIRRFRGQGRGKRCKERRERRRMRKEARKAAKLTRDGKIVLAEVEGEVLPSYQDGEGDRLVEKA